MTEPNPRQERIVGYFTEAEYKAFKHVAIDAGITLAAYIRKLVLAELRRVKEASNKPTSS